MTPQEFQLEGLSGEVDVSIDTWGVPHIRAHSAHDVFFGQGFVTAQRRLFQLDWWRRKGLGLMADVLGEEYIERDRAARLFLYRGDMRSEWLSYGVHAKGWTESYVAGINAWIEETEINPSLLSPEFAELGYRPIPWVATDIVKIRGHGLFGNLEEEVARAMTIREFGPDVEDLRKSRSPRHRVEIPEGLDLGAIDEDVLETYRLATGPVTKKQPPPETDGSNNWVISGERTTTGRPLLASDPHRAMTLPSLRHIVHLTCEAFDVIGAGEPSQPGVSIGHNGHVAFGYTIWKVDQEDLYVYELHPDDAELYWYRDNWVRMERTEEKIPVRGESQATAELFFTVHGPVLKVDQEKNTAFALRAAWLEPGMVPYLGSLHYLSATSGQELRTALNAWGSPGLNHLQADAKGNISWSPKAVVPIRPNWDGLLPVPGDGRYEWQGFRTADQMPEQINPEKGWFATANEYNLASDPEWTEFPVSYEWLSPHRASRLHEVLRDHHAVSIEVSAQLQNDYLSMPARLLCGLLSEKPFKNPDAESARQMLKDWDCLMRAESAPALLFAQWARGSLRKRLYKDALQRRVVAGGVDRADVDRALDVLTGQEESFGDWSVDERLIHELARDPARLGEMFEETLAGAVVELRQDVGEDMEQWNWGLRNRALFQHMAASFLSKGTPWSQVGGLQKSGNQETVGLAAPSPATGLQTTGASFRVVIDVGHWDRSIAINTPGQVGDPRSPHYDDLYSRWHRDEYFPLAYSEQAVAEHTKERWKLTPP